MKSGTEQTLRARGAALALGLVLCLASSVTAGGRAAATGTTDHARVMTIYGPPATRIAVPLTAIGRGKGVVFSPDFSTRTNRDFYEGLGFAYFEGPSWDRIVEEIEAYNASHTEAPVETLLLETHGTNGHGLKLQDGPDPTSNRSYISIGALQERLSGTGVKLVLVAACNSGRLFRPEIYYRLDPANGDELFKPATAGIVDASEAFHATQSGIVVARRADSHIENTTEGRFSELAPITRMLMEGKLGRKVGGRAPARATFVVSDMFIQLMLGDPSLRFTATGYVDRLDESGPSYASSERLYERFVRKLNALAGAPEKRVRKMPVKKKRARVR